MGANSSYNPTGGGGSNISNPSVAYVSTAGVNGTAAIGDPGKPYLTVQAAYNAGARNFNMGIGAFTLTLPVAGQVTLFVRGRGRGLTTLEIIRTGANGTTGVAGVNYVSAPGDGTPGENIAGVILLSDKTVTVSLDCQGGNGGTGGTGGGDTIEDIGYNGGVGGNAGALMGSWIYKHVIFDTIILAQGAVGAGGDGTASGFVTPGVNGADGQPADVSLSRIEDCEIEGPVQCEGFLWKDTRALATVVSINDSASALDNCIFETSLFLSNADGVSVLRSYLLAVEGPSTVRYTFSVCPNDTSSEPISNASYINGVFA